MAEDAELDTSVARIAPIDHSGLAANSDIKAALPIVRIHLLGSMRATTYLGADCLPRGRRARAILGCLCLAGGERITRARLAGMLWDRVTDFQARASFRQAFRELTVAFGPLAEELIVADRDAIKLNTDLCWIDALAVMASDLSPDRLSRSDLASLCSGELLEGLDGVSISFDQWLLAERTRFSETLRAQLESELRLAHRSTSHARERADIARRLIGFDPTHEGASRILMRALADMGERAQAMREYARCRDLLGKTLNIEPSPETHALYEAIRSGPEQGDEREIGPVPVRLRKNDRDAGTAPLGSRSRLRVGVLPFLAPPSPQEEGLALSLSQEIAAGLARFRWFDVIAPVTLMHRPAETDVNDDLLRRNELDYVVDGALSVSGDKFQVNVRLLDLMRYATPVWSERFELAPDDLHRIDEVMTARIVGRIDPVILFIEGQPKRRQQYGGTRLLMRAIPLMYSMQREKYEEAGRLIERALLEEPNDAMIAAWAAFWHVFYVGQGWTHDGATSFRTAQGLAIRAIKSDPNNAEALGIYAHICAFLDKDFDSALYYFDRSVRLNPSLGYVWALSAVTRCYIGQPDEALMRMDRYRDLAPFDPYFSFFEGVYVIAHLQKGEYERAATVGRRLVKGHPEFSNGYKPLIAVLGHLGRLEEAQPYITKLLELEPHFTVAQFGRVYPFQRDADRERYMEGLRVAGVPEGE